MKLRKLLSFTVLLLLNGSLTYSYTTKPVGNNIFTYTDSLFNTANIFQSGMVIQQQKPYAIWGSASAGSTVTVKADWTNKTTTITANADNYWKATVPVPKAIPGDFKTHTLTITSGGKAITLTNLLIGDVCVANKQSNKQFSVEGQEGIENGVLNYAQEIAAGNFPNIRWFYVDLNFKAQPYDQVGGKWVECSPKTVGLFSGVAYYFARDLYQHLNIPIGIVLSNIGASTGQAWTSRIELLSDTAL